MKYRRLEPEELDNLQEQFIRFLAAHSVTADDWENIKANKQEQVDKFIDDFSDLVITGTLQNIKYLRIVLPHDIKTFLCDEKMIYMKGLSVIDGEVLDFTSTPNEFELMRLIANNLEKLEAYELSKKYNEEREDELYGMLSNGCRISDGKVFEVITELIAAMTADTEHD